MFFVHAGKVTAWLAIALGLIRVSMGLFVATQFDGQADAVARYLGKVEASGDAIDQGLITLVIGVVVGLLAHSAGRRKRSPQSELLATRED
ncbi:hypothetical protein [Ruegeria sp. HKCCA6837]|uniref:hypothetical protein n=1 Tax=Ruegeria sp. HKCCA6837 TaxID=2682989 RepID=UPI001487D2A4|nr:hypothetical protein [Ruegeria sp. HKCCA6837]